MRNTLLASAALLGLTIAAPAFAQTTENTPATPPAAMPMKPHAMKKHASNIDKADTRATIAPALPVPPLGPDATPHQFLEQAQMALQHHRGGEAQEALERAETRMLDRSTMPSAADTPDMSPRIKQVSQALEAIAHKDWQQASQVIADLLKAPDMAANGGAGMAAPAMNGSSGTMGASGMNMNTDDMGAPAIHGDAAGMPPASGAMPAAAPQGTGTQGMGTSQP